MDKIMDNMQNGGMTSNFPGLSKDQIERLEQVTANLTGTAKIQTQQNLYQSALQQLKQNEVKDNRVQTENEMYYRSMNEKDPKQKNYLQSNVRLEQLADLTKSKFGLKQDANTKDVISGLMQYAQDQGISLDSLNSYLDSGDESFLYDMGLKEQIPEEEKGFWEEAGEIGKNLGAGLLDSALSIPRMAAEAGRFTGKRLASKVKGVDMDELPENEYTTALNKFIDEDSKIANVFGADEESTSYQVGKIGGDIAQTALGGGAVKGAIKEAPGLIGKFGNRLSKSKGTLGKIFQGGIEGAGDMTLFSIIADHKLPSREELGMGAGIGGVIPGAGKVLDLTKNGIKKIASKLELSGMLNPSKLNTIKNSLINEGVDLTSAGMKKGGTAEDVGRRMIERGMQGSKEQIIQKLGEHAKKSHTLKKEVLKQSETLHNVDSAKKSLEAMYEQVKGVPGLEEKTQRISELYNKDGLTLSELDEVKSLLDDTVNIYTNAGDVGASTLKEGLNNVRKDLRKYIETEADKEGLGNIKLLNNETQVSKSLQDAISRKDSADAAREMLSIFSKGTIGGALGDTAGGPFDGNTLPGKLGNILVGALAGQFLFSTQAKTKLASLLNKMTGGTKKELERLVNGEVKTVSKGTEKELQKIVEDLDLKEVNPQEFTKEEASRLLGNTIVNKTYDNEQQEEKESETVEK